MEQIPFSVAFQAGSFSHWVTLGVIFCWMVLSTFWVSRNRDHKKWRVFEKVAALILLIQYPLELWGHHQDSTPPQPNPVEQVSERTSFVESLGITRDHGLPLHWCNLAAFVAIFALWKRHAGAAELLYFWALAGTLQGLITPNLHHDFPSLKFIAFFLLHGGVVWAAVYLVIGVGLIPREGAWLRAVAYSLIYMIVIGAVNFFLKTNYGFLCGPPSTASLYDYLGEWPWYLLSVILLGTSVFYLLDLPFKRIRRRNPTL